VALAVMVVVEEELELEEEVEEVVVEAWIRFCSACWPDCRRGGAAGRC
jgi:hypothetical protein